jgi:hypothetical protein
MEGLSLRRPTTARRPARPPRLSGLDVPMRQQGASSPDTAKPQRRLIRAKPGGVLMWRGRRDHREPSSRAARHRPWQAPLPVAHWCSSSATILRVERRYTDVTLGV